MAVMPEGLVWLQLASLEAWICGSCRDLFDLTTYHWCQNRLVDRWMYNNLSGMLLNVRKAGCSPAHFVKLILLGLGTIGVIIIILVHPLDCKKCMAKGILCEGCRLLFN